MAVLLQHMLCVCPMHGITLQGNKDQALDYIIYTYDLGQHPVSASKPTKNKIEAYGAFLDITTGASMWAAMMFWGDHLVAESSFDENSGKATITWHGYPRQTP